MAEENELMDEMGSVAVPRSTVGGMDTQDLKEFIEYVVGDVADPPEVMNKIMNNLITKLSMGLGYNVVNNIGRQASLSKFLAVAEQRMFDLDDVKDMDKDQLSKLYAQAEKTLNGLQEFQRKFIVQNKDILKTDSTPQEKMVSKLMTLPPAKLDKIMNMIDAELNEEKVPEPEIASVDDFDEEV